MGQLAVCVVSVCIMEYRLKKCNIMIRIRIKFVKLLDFLKSLVQNTCISLTKISLLVQIGVDIQLKVKHCYTLMSP